MRLLWAFLYLALLVVLQSSHVVIGEDVSSETAAKHIASGVALQKSGAIPAALQSFSKAIDVDPDNYLTYYRRAIIYLSTGRHRQAFEDFEASIKRKPDFEQVGVTTGTEF